MDLILQSFIGLETVQLQRSIPNVFYKDGEEQREKEMERERLLLGYPDSLLWVGPEPEHVGKATV